MFYSNLTWPWTVQPFVHIQGEMNGAKRPKLHNCSTTKQYYTTLDLFMASALGAVLWKAHNENNNYNKKPKDK